MRWVYTYAINFLKILIRSWNCFPSTSFKAKRRSAGSSSLVTSVKTFLESGLIKSYYQENTISYYKVMTLYNLVHRRANRGGPRGPPLFITSSSSLFLLKIGISF